MCSLEVHEFPSRCRLQVASLYQVWAAVGLQLLTMTKALDWEEQQVEAVSLDQEQG